MNPKGTGRAALDLTNGPIARTLVVFSIPTLASSILQSLNASINAVWIGRLLGKEALSAAANANSLVFALLGGVFGLSMAATVLVGQALGGKNLVLAKRTIGTSFTFFGALAVAVSLLGVAFAPDILRGMHTPADALPFASAYLRVTFASLPASVLYAFAMMALRGAGDATTPFVFLCISAALDVGLNPVFIRGLGPVPALGIAGSGLATTIAQWVSLFLLVGHLYRKKHVLTLGRSELSYLALDRELVRTLITKGVPMGLSVVVVSTSALAMISLVNRYGTDTTAAYGACFQLWNYIQMPAFAVGTAVSAMAAQNIGAHRWDRVERVAKVGVGFNVLLTAALVLVVTSLDRAAFRLFLRDATTSVEIARHVHHVVSWSFVLFGISFVLASVMRAAGAVVPPLVMMFVAFWGVRFPMAYLLTSRWHAEAIWTSFPVGTVVLVGLTIAYYLFGPWRSARMMTRDVAEAPAIDVPAPTE